MTVNIDHPWSTRKFTDEEIEQVLADQAESREDPVYKDHAWPGRLFIRTMDRLYVRALRKGLNAEEARTSAPNHLYVILGFLLGWAFCIVVLSIGTLLWDYATAAKWINFSLTAIWAVVLIGLFTGFLQKRVTRLFRKVRSKKES
jgi:hypothetical protein